MKRTYKEIETSIINYTIDYLIENDKISLYNEIVCKNVNITRHVLYNHFENVWEIYNRIIEEAEKIIEQFLIVELPTEEYLIYSIKFIYENKKLLDAALKIKPDFFKSYHTIKQEQLHNEFLKIDNIPYKTYMEAFQISGFLGIINEIRNVKSEEQLQELINCVLLINKIINNYFMSNTDIKN